MPLRNARASVASAPPKQTCQTHEFSPAHEAHLPPGRTQYLLSRFRFGDRDRDRERLQRQAGVVRWCADELAHARSQTNAFPSPKTPTNALPPTHTHAQMHTQRHTQARAHTHPHQAIAEEPGGGGGCLGPWPAPADQPPLPHQKFFLRQKMKFIKGAGNLRPISGTQTFFLASDPPPLALQQ